ncbi:ABC transporter permease [Nonomuraea sp. 10N515B]|uniref:ABC transporter permease n=1 Tax=Nonomuraea sp. 10N515B TaxID=3457422 RepID=UPI003FCC9AC4
MRAHLRLMRRFLIQALVRETHYRAHFVATLTVGLAELLVGLLPVWFLYGHADEVNGWTGAEVVALVGAYQITTGLLATFVAPNLTRMTAYLTKGELDLVLIRPVSAQFYLTFRWIRLAELGKAATGLIALCSGLAAAGVRPGPIEVVQAILLGCCGLVLLTCAWSALVYLAFWTQGAGPITVVFDAFMEAGRYPLAYYPAAARAFLTFAFPVGFATSFPIEALTDGVGWLPVLGGVAMCVAAVAALRLYWRLGVRGYSSASS